MSTGRLAGLVLALALVAQQNPGMRIPETRKPPKGGGPKNTNPDGPAHPGGPVYVRTWNDDAKVWAWRARELSLYYKDNSGTIHAYQPGQDEARDRGFVKQAKTLGLVIMTRPERRKLHREERARYKAILRKRQSPQVYESADVTLTVDGRPVSLEEVNYDPR